MTTIQRHGQSVVYQGERMTANASELFDGHDALFRDLLVRCQRYGEYGMGQSTLAAAGTAASAAARQIQAVDTSAQWLAHVAGQLTDEAAARVRLVHVDLGPVGSWGFPKSYAHRDRFSAYFDAPWQGAFDPDLVLIDGRFRVACFLTSLLRAKPGTLILFDDYTERAYYHIVETFLTPEQRTTRQALFRVPEAVDRDGVSGLLERFVYVMD